MSLNPGYVVLLALAVLLPRAARAQTDSAKVAQRITSAGALLDTASKAKGARPDVIRNAAIIYAAAVAQLDSGNYAQAQRLARVATELAQGADHGPMEIGARIDSIPFGVTPIGAGVP